MTSSTVIQLTSLCSSEVRKILIKSYQLPKGDAGCVLSSRGDYTGECILLPPRMQAWLKGERVSRTWRVAGEAVGLRGKAFQSRSGMSLERDMEEFQHMTTKFQYFLPVCKCRCVPAEVLTAWLDCGGHWEQQGRQKEWNLAPQGRRANQGRHHFLDPVVHHQVWRIHSNYSQILLIYNSKIIEHICIRPKVHGYL